jgi:hypothetical protein
MTREGAKTWAYRISIEAEETASMPNPITMMGGIGGSESLIIF